MLELLAITAACGFLAFAVGRSPKYGAAVILLFVVYLPRPVPAEAFNRYMQFSLDVDMLMGIFLVVLALVYWNTCGRPSLDWRILAVPAIFIIFGLLAALYSGADLVRPLTWPSIWLAGIIIGACCREDYNRLQVIGLGMIPSAIIQIYGQLTHSTPWLDALRLNQYDEVIYSAVFRSPGTFSHPLVAGCTYMLVAVGLMACRVRSARYAAPLLVAAGFLTISRSAAIGLMVGVIALLVFQSSRSHRWLTMLVGGICCLQVGIWASPTFKYAIENRFLSGFGSQEVRLAGPAYIMEMFENNPLGLILGGGYNTSRAIASTLYGPIRRYQTFDNQYVTWLLDYGFVVLCIAAILIVWTIVRSRSFAVAPPVVAAAAMIYFANIAQFEAFGIFMGFFLGMASSSERASEATGDVRPEAATVTMPGVQHRHGVLGQASVAP